MPRINTPKFGIGYGWSLGETPGTQALDDFRLITDAAMKTDFGYNPIQSSGLNYYYYGGTLFDQYGQISTYAMGHITLANDTTNYVYRVNQNVTSNTTGFPLGCMPMAIVTTLAGYITAVQDVRPCEPTAAQVRYKSSNVIIGSNSTAAALDQIGEYLKILLGGLRRAYIHTQSVASTSWVINHNLNQSPAVTVMDTLGNVLMAEIDYTTLNTVTITFSTPQDGTAHLIYAVASAQIIYEQLNPAAEWIIVHNLAVNPIVDLTDLIGNVITGQVAYIDSHTIRITFADPATGRAFLRL